MRRLLAVTLMLFAVGCSIMDPGDREELRKRIQLMPENQMSMFTREAMKVAAHRFLEGKRDTERIGKLECRVKEDGAWSDWYEHLDDLRVPWMRDCLWKQPLTFMMCIEFWQAEQVTDRREFLKATATNPDSIDVECRFIPDPGYEPEKLPSKMIDSKAISIDDIIDTLVALPAPPPGWAFPELVPLLCPLGAGEGWGCPPRPDDPPGGQPTDPSGQSGDYP